MLNDDDDNKYDDDNEDVGNEHFVVRDTSDDNIYDFSLFMLSVTEGQKGGRMDGRTDEADYRMRGIRQSDTSDNEYEIGHFNR